MFPKCWHWLNWFDPFPLILTSWKIWPIKPRKCDKRAQILQMSMNDHLPQWQKWHEVCAMEGLGGGGQAYHDNGRILRVLGCRTRCDGGLQALLGIHCQILNNKKFWPGADPPSLCQCHNFGNIWSGNPSLSEAWRYQMTIGSICGGAMCWTRMSRCIQKVIIVKELKIVKETQIIKQVKLFLISDILGHFHFHEWEVSNWRK